MGLSGRLRYERALAHKLLGIKPVNPVTKQTVNMEKLQLLNAFAILCERSVNLLRDQRLERSHPETPAEFLSRLERLARR